MVPQVLANGSSAATGQTVGFMVVKQFTTPKKIEQEFPDLGCYVSIFSIWFYGAFMENMGKIENQVFSQFYL